MLKKIISIFMAMTCLMSFTPINPDILITHATSYFLGSGTESDPYQISTANDLTKLSSLINSKDTNRDYRYAYYIQTSDIDLNGEAFIPIGGSGEPTLFAGSYDGNFHSINNLYIASSERFVGLFGRIGEFDKDNSKSVITNLCVQGNVESIGETGLYVGGIAGEIAYSANIVNCCFIGTASNGQYVGGISGRSWCGGSTISCYSNSVLSSTMENAHIGGIIGDVTIGENSVTGSSDFMMKNCYFSGDIISENEQFPGGIIGYIYYSTVNTAVKLELLNNFYLTTACNYGVGTDNANGCTKLSSVALNSCADMLGSPFIDNDDSNLNDGYPVFEWQITPESFDGLGTPKNPYKIKNADDLQRMAQLVNSKYFEDEFRSASYIQTNNIDLQDKEWIPIADAGYNKAFLGTYDGNKHCIRGLKINGSSNNCGLFGTISDEATVSNLVVYGDLLSTGDNIGRIIGEIRCGASITECAYIGNVKGNVSVGGIAGKVWDSGVILNCYSYGNVTAINNSGGIAGSIMCKNGNGTSIVKNCYHVGEVLSENNMSGGIVGLSDHDEATGNVISIKNCYYLYSSAPNGVNGSAVFGDCSDLKEVFMKEAYKALGSPFVLNPYSSYVDGYLCFEWQIKGDANDDGKVSVADAVMLQKWLLAAGPLTDWQEADIYEDGRIDVFDLVLLKRYLVNLGG